MFQRNILWADMLNHGDELRVEQNTWYATNRRLCSSGTSYGPICWTTETSFALNKTPDTQQITVHVPAEHLMGRQHTRLFAFRRNALC